MADGGNDTQRVPPVVAGAAGELADLLRQEPGGLDDVRRARMERALVQAWRTRGAAHVPLPRSGTSAPTRMTWAGSMAASAVVGVLVGLFALQLPGDDGKTTTRAEFELRIGDAAVQRGEVAEGQVLESGKHGRLEISMSASRITLARHTRVRFERLGRDDKRLMLSTGRVDVGFHPARRGEERLSVLTRSATVNVIGTQFSVEVDSQGNTDVSVTEGVVEVVPRQGGDVMRVSAGESTHVRFDDEPYERAVREAIAESLVAGDAVEPDPDALEQALAVTDDAEPAGEEGAEVEAPARPRRPGPSLRARLSAARDMLRQGKHNDARERLRAIADGPYAIIYRVEALTLIAESYTAQGYIPRAADFYRKAAHIAPGHAAGHNALFALARLLERYTLDEQAAISAYRTYLRQAPDGALASQAREALCRLGDEC